MKIIVIGATGAVGRGIVQELSKRHDIVRVGRRTGDFHADITRPETVRELFGKIGLVDAIICAAGQVHFAPLAQMTDAQFRVGLNDKLMGQVGLAMIAVEHLRDRGSITLTSGILADRPILNGASASMVNAAIEGFVRSAAIELPHIRINAVSPTVLSESLDDYGPYFRGFEPASAARVALAYSRSVEGAESGQTYRVH